MVAEPTSPGKFYDKFSERGRRVMAFAQEEAQRLNHNYIGTEHILLGLIREVEGVAAEVLLSLGVELSTVRSGVEFIVGHGERPFPGEIGLTPRTRAVLKLAVDEADRLKHRYVGTEHLLIGIMREGCGVAAGVLESFGVTLEVIRAETGRVLEARSGRAIQKAEVVQTPGPVSDEEIAQILERVEQSLNDLEGARTLLLRLQAERTAQKPQEPA